MGHRARGQGPRRRATWRATSPCSAPCARHAAGRSVSPPAGASPCRAIRISPRSSPPTIAGWPCRSRKGPGPRRVHVTSSSGSSTRMRRFRSLETGPGPFPITIWTYFDANGTRLLFPARRRPESAAPGNSRFVMIPSRHVIELWDLTGPKRLMSTADTAPEPTVHAPQARIQSGQSAFATFHDPQNNPDGIGAIVWDTSTGNLIGRYKGNLLPSAEAPGMAITSSSTTISRPP